MSTDEIRTLIERAIEIAGSEAKLAAAGGCSQNAVWAAKKAGRVSAEMATRIETATKGEIPRWRLRPDLWSEGSERPFAAPGGDDEAGSLKPHEAA